MNSSEDLSNAAHKAYAKGYSDGRVLRLTDSERAALVADLTVILQRVKYVKLGESLRPIAEEIIDKLLADRAVPEHPDLTTVYQKGYQDGAEWLDKALDSVHRDASVRVWLESPPEPEVGLPHYFEARLDHDGPFTVRPFYGQGLTRREAIQDAVANAQKGRE